MEGGIHAQPEPVAHCSPDVAAAAESIELGKLGVLGELLVDLELIVHLALLSSLSSQNWTDST